VWEYASSLVVKFIEISINPKLIRVGFRFSGSSNSKREEKFKINFV